MFILMCGFRNAAHRVAFGGTAFLYFWSMLDKGARFPVGTSFAIVSSLISFVLTLVGPATMELGREEIQTDLPRLGECE